MADRVSRHIEALESFLRERDWSIADQRDIEHGRQVIVTDGSARVPINFFNTGSIVVQGRPCEMKHALTEWTKHIRESGPGSPAAIPAGSSLTALSHTMSRRVILRGYANSYWSCPVLQSRKLSKGRERSIGLKRIITGTG